MAYFLSIWNYIDLAPPTFIVLCIIQFWLDPDHGHQSESETVLRALASFFVWMKLLYFFRVYQSFAYLIRMIVEVVKDM